MWFVVISYASLKKAAWNTFSLRWINSTGFVRFQRPGVFAVLTMKQWEPCLSSRMWRVRTRRTNSSETPSERAVVVMSGWAYTGGWSRWRMNGCFSLSIETRWMWSSVSFNHRCRQSEECGGEKDYNSQGALRWAASKTITNFQNFLLFFVVSDGERRVWVFLDCWLHKRSNLRRRVNNRVIDKQSRRP